MTWNGRMFMAVARSRTVNGGLRWMIFSLVGAAASGAVSAGAAGATISCGAGATTAAALGASGSRIFEIGMCAKGLLVNSDAVCGRRFGFASISETVSWGTFGGAGGAVSLVAGAGSELANFRVVLGAAPGLALALASSVFFALALLVVLVGIKVFLGVGPHGYFAARLFSCSFTADS